MSNGVLPSEAPAARSELGQLAALPGRIVAQNAEKLGDDLAVRKRGRESAAWRARGRPPASGPRTVATDLKKTSIISRACGSLLSAVPGMRTCGQSNWRIAFSTCAPRRRGKAAVSENSTRPLARWRRPHQGGKVKVPEDELRGEKEVEKHGAREGKGVAAAGKVADKLLHGPQRGARGNAGHVVQLLHLGGKQGVRLGARGRAAGAGRPRRQARRGDQRLKGLDRGRGGDQRVGQGQRRGARVGGGAAPERQLLALVHVLATWEGAMPLLEGARKTKTKNEYLWVVEAFEQGGKGLHKLDTG